jgi:hypothetical protein
VLLFGEHFRPHRGWLVVCAAGTLLALAWFAADARGRPDWPGGSSPPGFAFGALGGLIVLFEFALWPRKWPVFRRLRVGRVRLGPVERWMRAHVWLGLLCLPLIVLHSGLRLGGPLSTVLMGLFLLVVASGVWGLAVQQFLPRRMLEEVPAETVASQIEHVMAGQTDEARRLIEAVCGPEPGADKPAARPAARPVAGARTVWGFFRTVVEPYLVRGAAARSPLRVPHRAGELFGDLRARLDPAAHGCVDNLERLCEQRRQLDRQARLNAWMHNWLCLHLPLSVALVALMAVHVWAALRYW